MMLKADMIAALLLRGREKEAKDPLVIAPCPDLKQLSSSGSASIDLRLGTWFVTLRRGRMSHLQIGDSMSQSQLTREQYVPFGNAYYLHPRSFVLAGTLEWIRLPSDLAGYIIGKSSWGRRGLIIATAAAVHPGFKGCLTLELTNLSEVPIEIRPRMPVGQLCLHRVDTADRDSIDQSGFVGQRKPSLGVIQLDDISAQLADSKI